MIFRDELLDFNKKQGANSVIIYTGFSFFQFLTIYIEREIFKGFFHLFYYNLREGMIPSKERG